MAFVVAADYADLLEAHEDRRQQEAPVAATVERRRHPPPLRAPAARLRDRHPGLGRRPASPSSPDRWASRIELAPQAGATFELQVDAIDPDQDMDETARAARLHHHRPWREGLTRVVVPGNPLAERILGRAARTSPRSRSLEGEPDEWLALQAGMPLYPAFFGRDALTAGWQGGAARPRRDARRGAHPAGPAAVGPGLRLARRGAGQDPLPGAHGPARAARDQPLLRLLRRLREPVDVRHLARQPLRLDRRARPTSSGTGTTACRILEWADTYGDRDGDGYLEYLTRSPAGTKNQGWKDSGDAIVDEDGRPVPAPIATCELQGYWYAAQQLMAVLAWVIGERRRARELWRAARALKQRFNRDFWDPEERFYGLALDPDKRLVRAATSNVGHCLATGIIARERLRDVADRLLAPDMFSGWGIRTLTTRHPCLQPAELPPRLGVAGRERHHLLRPAADGLRRRGAARGRGALPAVASSTAATGYPRPWAATRPTSTRPPGPTRGRTARRRGTPAPCRWSLQSLLGLMPYAALHVLVVDPLLPAWLPGSSCTGSGSAAPPPRCASGATSDGRTHARVLEKDGPLHLIRQPPPEAIGVGFGRRLRALLPPR